MAEAITDDEHREALGILSKEFADRGLRMLALGSSAVLLKAGIAGGTKDIDIHLFPIGDVLEYTDVIEEIAKGLGGHSAWKPDGAVFVMHIRVRGSMIPVEIIEGGADFIELHVFEDMRKSAKEVNGVLVPSWEHIVGMKAEAWWDRTGSRREEYREDLVAIAQGVEQGGEKLDATELERVIRLRQDKKHDGMLELVFRTFEAVL